jgi:hypothetical protein
MRGLKVASKLEWNGPAFEKHLRNATAKGLKRAGVFYHSKCQEIVSRPNTGVSVKVIRKTPGGNKRSRTIYPNPSKPGEAPKLRTGFGRRNIVVNFDPNGKYVRVGVTANGIYMFYLEVGTRRIARRPWLLRTLMENQEIIGKLAASGD